MNPEIIFPPDWDWHRIGQFLAERNIGGWWYGWKSQVVWVIDGRPH